MSLDDPCIADLFLEHLQHLRLSLVPVAAEWQSILEEMKTDVFMKKEWKVNHTLRKQLLVQYRVFERFNRELSKLAKTDPYEMMQQQGEMFEHVKEALQRQSFYESIGDDLMILAQYIERSFIELGNRKYRNCLAIMRTSSLIKKTIRLIKVVYDLIPLEMRNSIIASLNRSIVKRNKMAWWYFDPHGIILQLAKEKDPELGCYYTNDIAVLYTVVCEKCNQKTEVPGGLDDDVFAPLKCSKCKSTKLSKQTIQTQQNKNQTRH